MRRSLVNAALAVALGPTVALAACEEDASINGGAIALDGAAPFESSTSVVDSSGAEDAPRKIQDAAPACDASVNACIVSAWSACIDEAMKTEACALGCGPTGCLTTCDASAVVIDQSIADDYTLIPPWQSFEVAATGVLTELEMRPNVYSPTDAPSTLTLSIYVGEGATGTRIAQQVYVVPAASGAPLASFVFTTPVPLQAGQKYTWEMTGAGGLYYAKSNTYPNGRASAGSFDMVFKAHVRACR